MNIKAEEKTACPTHTDTQVEHEKSASQMLSNNVTVMCVAQASFWAAGATASFQKFGIRPINIAWRRG